MPIPSAIPHAAHPRRPSLQARAARLLGAGLLAWLSLLPLAARAELSLPNGDYREEVEELRVKVLGGYVKVTRQWQEDRWHINRNWNPLTFETDPLDGSVKRIGRNDATFERIGSSDGYKSGPRYLIVKRAVRFIPAGSGEGSAPTDLNGSTPEASLGGGIALGTDAAGYRFTDRDGNWIDYDSNGKLVAYGERNAVTTFLEYGSGNAASQLQKVRDHFGRTVLCYTYSNGQISEIRDNPAINPDDAPPARRLIYTWVNNQLTQATDVTGQATTYAYTGNRLSQITDPEARVRQITYGPTGRVQSIREADGAVTSYAYDYDKTRRTFYVRTTHPATEAGTRIEERWYDADGYLIRRDDAGLTQLAITRDTASRTRTNTDLQGNPTVTTLDEFDNVVRTVFADGSETRARYATSHGQILEETDELGVKTQYDYDGKGNLLKKTEAVGLPEQRVTSYTRDPFGQITSQTIDGGAVALPGGGSVTVAAATTTTRWDNRGNPVQGTDPEGNTTRIVYDRLGNPLTVTDARGKVWQNTWNARGQILTQANPLNQKTVVTYDKSGLLMTQDDAENRSTAFTWTTRGQLASITDALGNVRQRYYDAVGQFVGESDELGQRQNTLSYDLAGRPSQSKDGSGNVTTFTYGADGKSQLPSKVRYPTFEQETTYDSRQRATAIKEVLSEAPATSTQQAYDKKGNLTQLTDRNGKITTMTYDGLTRLIQGTDAGGGITRYAYDTRDNLLAVQDPNGNSTQYTYDRNNRKTVETRPLGQMQSTTWDEAGNLTKQQDAKGNQIQTTYDAANRRVEEKHLPAGGGAGRTIAYTYNAAGALTGYTDSQGSSASYTLDALHRKTQEAVTIAGNTWTSTTTWTPTGQKARFTSPGGLKADYTYDVGHNLDSVVLPGGTISIGERLWNAPRKVTFPGGSQQTRDYDVLMRPTRIKVNGPGQATLVDRQYTFDAESNITQKATEHGNYDYQYDDLYRLTQVGSPSGLPNEAWTYDKLGNRLTDRNRSGIWQYNGNNQLIRSFTTSGEAITLDYDDDGSLIRKQSTSSDAKDNQQFRYDAQNRLVDVLDKDSNPIATYQYDPFGRRIAKTSSGNTTYYLYSDEGLIAEATALGIVAVEYGWQPQGTWGTDPLFIRTTQTNGLAPEIFYYQNDHLGTPQKTIDSQGDVVWEMKALAFGETAVSNNAVTISNLRFPGQYYDMETGTHQNYFRDYDPAVGRYRQSDPIGLAGGINTYLYAMADPIQSFDSTGENPGVGAAIALALATARAAMITCAKNPVCRCRAVYAAYKVMCGVGCKGPTCPFYEVQVRAASLCVALRSMYITMGCDRYIPTTRDHPGAVTQARQALSNCIAKRDLACATCVVP